MRKKSFLFLLFMSTVNALQAQEKNPLVNYESFEQLVATIKPYRAQRLLTVDSFIAYSKQKNTIILDTRSENMYKQKHLKGAINLPFTDFTQANLAQVIPATTTRILIYCNNNFSDDQVNFASKMALPVLPLKEKDHTPLTLALNIPTFINLYGYGYKNIYELNDLLSVRDQRILFEGTTIRGRLLPMR